MHISVKKVMNHWNQDNRQLLRVIKECGEHGGEQESCSWKIDDLWCILLHFSPFRVFYCNIARKWKISVPDSVQLQLAGPELVLCVFQQLSIYHFGLPLIKVGLCEHWTWGSQVFLLTEWTECRDASDLMQLHKTDFIPDVMITSE